MTKTLVFVVTFLFLAACSMTQAEKEEAWRAFFIGFGAGATPNYVQNWNCPQDWQLVSTMYFKDRTRYIFITPQGQQVIVDRILAGDNYYQIYPQ